MSRPSPEFPARSRIIIVDDDPLSRRLVMRSLEQEYEVVECPGGYETMQLLEGAGPALVVLDYEMPDLNGAQVCELVRASPDPEVAQCPIIMLTGHSNAQHEIECLRSGADDFVTKPLNVAVLRARIETHLRLHSMRKQLLAQNVELETWRRRQEEDLEAARLTQQAILPARLPSVHGWDFAALYLPLMRIGGDMYDWFMTPAGLLLVWMSDATGHGASAALLTTLSKVLFRHAVTEAHTPAVIMDYVEREFQGVFKGHSFMTAACLAISADDGRVTFCGAGQPPLLLARKDGPVEFLRSMRPPLGLNRAEHSIEENCELAAGDALLLYTDGLYEVQGATGERLGNEGLANSLPKASAGMAANEWLQEIIEKVRAYASSDIFPDDIAAFAAVRGRG